MSKRKSKSDNIIELFFSNPYPKFRMNMDIEGIDSSYLRKTFKNIDFIRKLVIKINTEIWDLATLNDVCLCHDDFSNIIDSLILLYHDEIIDMRTGHLILFEIMRNCMFEGYSSVIDEGTKNTDNITLPYYIFNFDNTKDFNIEDNLFMTSELGRFAKEIGR